MRGIPIPRTPTLGLITAAAVVVVVSVYGTPAEPSDGQRVTAPVHPIAYALINPTGNWLVGGDERDALHIAHKDQPDKPVFVLEQSLVNSVGDLEFSPRGDRLVYTYGQQGERNLMMLMLPPSGAPVQLTREIAPIDLSKFSPDGQRVAFLSKGELFVVDLRHLDRAPEILSRSSAGRVLKLDSFRWEGSTIEAASHTGQTFSVELSQ